MKLKVDIADGELHLLIDDDGITVRLYNSEGSWVATSGIANSRGGEGWATWCADINNEDWTTKHIDKEKRDVQNPSS